MPHIGQVVQFWEDGFGYPQAAIVVASRPTSEAISLRIIAAGGRDHDRTITGVTQAMDFCSSQVPMLAVVHEGSVVFRAAETSMIKGRWSEVVECDGLTGNMYRAGEIAPKSGTFQMRLPQETAKA